MKERLLVLALAIGALGLFYVLMFPKPSLGRSEIVLPLSSESGPDGYLAAWRWLGAQDIPAVRLRYRYDRLPGLLARPAGNLLLVTVPQRVPARAAELADLEKWVERGNTLLVMAALEDTPLWTLGADPLLAERLQRMTGLELSPPQQSARSLASLAADKLDIEPRGKHALLAAVGHVTALSPLPARRWQMSLEDGLMPLELAERTDGGDPALWLERRGAGQIILFTVGSAFSNAALSLTDNAQLLANIVAWSLAPGGAVIFDDAHQGATAFYDGKAFFADPRLHHTLAWIVLLWLAFVLGALPLRAAQRPWQPLDEATYVEASACYFAAVVRPSDAAQRLIEDFLHGLRERLGLAEDASLWPWLEAQAGV
ncbi:MAG: DUF4350 domain-containing protein, partial [Steroidobacteraceae bacterium]